MKPETFLKAGELVKQLTAIQQFKTEAKGKITQYENALEAARKEPVNEMNKCKISVYTRLLNVQWDIINDCDKHINEIERLVKLIKD